MAGADGDDRGGDEQITVLVVRDGGRGTIQQWTWSRRRLTQSGVAAASVLSLLVAVALGGSAGLHGGSDRDRVVAENIALRTQLDEAKSALDEAQPLLRRVRAYDDELRDLAKREALPGFGPLDEEAMADREKWLSGVVGKDALDQPATDVLSQAVDVEKRASEVRADAKELGGRLAQLGTLLDRLTAMSDGMPQLWPVQGGLITSGYGCRMDPFGHSGEKFHTGLDIGVPFGTPVHTTNDGVVTYAAWDTHGCGNKIQIDHGGEIATRYCHLSSILVAAGDTVSTGEMIGLVGSTGASTGPHLHYEMWFGDETRNPLDYLPKR